MKFNIYVMITGPTGFADIQNTKGFMSENEAERYLAEQKAWINERIRSDNLTNVKDSDVEWLIMSRDEAVNHPSYKRRIEEFEQAFGVAEECRESDSER